MTVTVVPAQGDGAAIGDALAIAPRPVAPERVAAIAREHYGIDGSATPLHGEKDGNFHLAAAQGDYLMKVVNPHENPAVTDLQTRALLHIEASAPDLQVQRVIRARSGATETSISRPNRAFSGVEAA